MLYFKIWVTSTLRLFDCHKQPLNVGGNVIQYLCFIFSSSSKLTCPSLGNWWGQVDQPGLGNNTMGKKAWLHPHEVGWAISTKCCRIFSGHYWNFPYVGSFWSFWVALIVEGVFDRNHQVLLERELVVVVGGRPGRYTVTLTRWTLSSSSSSSPNSSWSSTSLYFFQNHALKS